MKVCFKGISKFSSPKEIEALKEFVTYLQTELPLKDDVFITFKGGRDIKMTTGVRMPKNQIFVLADKRLLIDILRTVAHEWVHEFQHQKMGLKDTDKIQNIGGPEENMANTLSGIFVKKFDKENPQYSQIIYGEEE
jgi:hypothetical protein